MNCPGQSREGKCLAETCRELGSIPEFEIDRDGYWLIAHD